MALEIDDKTRFFDIVFFHYPCQDGLASAWIVKKYHDENDKYIELRGINHSESIDIEVFRDKNVLFCDITPLSCKILNSDTENSIECFEKYCKKIVILDHHISAQESLKNKSYAIFDMSKSGATLTWSYFYENRDIPLFIKMIEDRDLWRWNIEKSEEFTTAFYKVIQQYEHYDFNSMFEEFYNLHREHLIRKTNILKKYIEFGTILRKATNNDVKFIVKKCSRRIDNYKDYKICIVNCPNEYISEVGNLLSSKDEIDFAILWRHDHVENKYFVSLRSCGDIDVSKIAKEFGGGGHKNASGFLSDILPKYIFT